MEAKTPEGTRVATPNRISAVSIAGPSVSQRTASYAGAVKSVPVDWHLEFSLDGKPVSLDETIYGAMHKHQHVAGGGSSQSGVYGLPVTFKFKKVDGPAPTSQCNVLTSR